MNSCVLVNRVIKGVRQKRLFTTTTKTTTTPTTTATITTTSTCTKQ